VLVGDILVSFNGKAADDTDDVQTALESAGVGETVKADLLRGGLRKQVPITVGERPRRD
jgi:S1-C subfamily serine protease